MATHKTYDPDHITKETFQSLLARYPSTVESTTRRKVTTTTEKRSASSSSSSSSRPKSQSASKDRATEDPDDAPAAVQTYLALDEFRYTTLPEAVRQRASTTIGDVGGGAYLEKEELVRLVEWKMKHGKFRPALLGMIRSNPDGLVREATGSAFRLLKTPMRGRGMMFPGTALETVTGPLRGVGPATGSLVLSVLSSSEEEGQGQGVPFYSDDVFLWLCLGVFPGGDPGKVGKAFRSGKSGELNVKYTVGEYRQLWEAVRRLRARLGVGAGAAVGCAEIEKVAFVVRFGGLDGMEEKDEGEKKEGKEGSDLPDTRGKRKRGNNEEKEEEEEEEKEQKVDVRRSTRRRGGK